MMNKNNFYDKGILVIDDVSEMRMLAKGFLAAAGFTDIPEARDGQNAYNILNERSIDLVICDWEMPNINGMELFQLMQRNNEFRHIPFIMATGRDDKRFVIEALKMGIHNYVVKPFSPEILVSKVKKLLL